MDTAAQRKEAVIIAHLPGDASPVDGGCARIAASPPVNSMPSPSEPSRPASPHVVLRLPRRALVIAAIAFGVGLLLFVIVWWAGRDKRFYTAEPLAGLSTDTVVEALPEPMPAGDGASGMEEAPASPPDERPQLVETAPAPLQNAVPAAADAQAATPPANGNTSPALAPGASPVPLAGQTPAPVYPPSAMRRRETGTVLLHVDVGVDGIPTRVQLAERSGSRALDRAAVEAVRRWRFSPAQRDGQPIPSSIVIPVDFNLQ
jgi:protein TonB